VPKTTKTGKPKQSELPSTLRRSPEKAQETFAETHDSALETYDGDEQAAHRVAYGAVKHSFEKVGDHWERKGGGRQGPSDPQSARGSRDTDLRSRAGVDESAPKSELYEIAKKLDIDGRSTMSKRELLDAIERANARETRKARKS
jgi:cation transport regulator ChaB